MLHALGQAFTIAMALVAKIPPACMTVLIAVTDVLVALTWTFGAVLGTFYDDLYEILSRVVEDHPAFTTQQDGLYGLLLVCAAAASCVMTLLFIMLTSWRATFLFVLYVIYFGGLRLVRFICLHSHAIRDTLAPGRIELTTGQAANLRNAFLEQPFDPPSTDGSTNGHADAAATRSGADTIMRAVAALDGRDCYDVARSSKSMRSGTRGIRYVIDAKDATTFHQGTGADARGPEDTTMNIYQDVLCHMDERQVAEALCRKSPSMAYVIHPTAPAGTSHGVGFAYVGEGQFEYALPDSVYRHQLWAWDGETRRIRSDQARYTTNGYTLLVIVAVFMAFSWTAYSTHMLFQPGPGPGAVYLSAGVAPWYSKIFGDGAGCYWTPRLTTIPDEEVAAAYKAGRYHFRPIQPYMDWLAEHVYGPAHTWYNQVFGGTALMPTLPTRCHTGWELLSVRSLAEFALNQFTAWSVCWAFLIVMYWLFAYYFDWRDYMFKITRRDLGEHRAIVLITPCVSYNAFERILRNVDDPASPMYGPPMRRWRCTESVFKGVRYFSMRVLGKPDYFTYSSMLAAPGATANFFHVKISQGAQAAMELMLAHSPTVSGSTLTTAVNRAHKLEADWAAHVISNEQGLLLKGAIMAQAGKAHEGTSLTERSTGSAIATYSYGVPTPEDMEKVPRLKDWMPPMVPGGAHVPMENQRNVEAGIDIRVERNRNHNMPSPADIRRKNHFVAHFGEQLRRAGFEPMSIVDSEVVAERQCRPDQLRTLQFALEHCCLTDIRAVAVRRPDFPLNSGMKPKEVTRKPRLITTPSTPELKLITARYAYSIADAMKIFPWYASSMTPEQIAESIIAKAAVLPYDEVIYEFDVSNMDSRHSDLSHQVFIECVSLMVRPEDREALVNGAMLLKGEVKPARSSAYQLGWMLGSGLWNTTIKNGIIGAFLEFSTRCKAGHRPSAAWASLGLHAGDDALYFGMSVRNRKLSSDGSTITIPQFIANCTGAMGFVGKVVPRDARGTKIGFLGRFYDASTGESYVDPERFVVKFTISGLPPSYTDKDRAISKALSYGVVSGAGGMVNMICRHTLRKRAPEMLRVLERHTYGSRETALDVWWAHQDEHQIRELRWSAKQVLIYPSSAYRPAHPDVEQEAWEDALGHEYVQRLLEWLGNDGELEDIPQYTGDLFKPSPAPGYEGAIFDGEPLENGGEPIVPFAGELPEIAEELDVMPLSAIPMAISAGMTGGAPVIVHPSEHDASHASGSSYAAGVGSKRSERKGKGEAAASGTTSGFKYVANAQGTPEEPVVHLPKEAAKPPSRPEKPTVGSGRAAAEQSAPKRQRLVFESYVSGKKKTALPSRKFNKQLGKHLASRGPYEAARYYSCVKGSVESTGRDPASPGYVFTADDRTWWTGLDNAMRERAWHHALTLHPPIKAASSQGTTCSEASSS